MSPFASSQDQNGKAPSQGMEGRAASQPPSRPEKTGSTRLDPYGIYGTRSANRVLLARRRRRLQNLLATCAFLAVVVFALTGVRYRPIPSGRVTGGVPLRGRPAAPLASTSNGSLLVPCWSGELLLVPPLANGGFGRESGSVAQVRGKPVLAAAFPLRAQPAVRGRMAYVPCEDGTLYAVDWQEGRQRWKYSGRVPLSCAPALVERPGSGTPGAPGGGGVVVQGDDEGLLVGLDASTGRMLWRRRASGPVGNGIAVVPQSSQVLVPLLPGLTAGGGVLGLDGLTGKVLWTYPVRDADFCPVLAPPAALPGSAGLAVLFGTDDGQVARLNWVNGKSVRVWKVPVGSPGGETAGVELLPGSEPVLLRGGATVMAQQNLVVVGGNDGGVRGLDADTGTLRWVVGTGGAVRLAPQLLRWSGQDVCAVAADNGTVWALSGQGQVLRRWKVPGVPASLQPAGERLLTAMGDGTLYTLEP